MKNTRRKFVKQTTFASAGIVLAPSFKANGMFNVLNDKKLKVALVGCGGRGSGAANQALQADENIELVAMADAFEDRLSSSYNNLYEKYKDSGKVNVKEKNKFVGFDAYKKAIDLADVVILATPPGFRPTHFAYAVGNGKHVFMEKPVATDVPGIQKVLKYAREASDKNLKVVVGLQRRYQENYLAVLEEIKKGTVGNIVGGQVYWNSDGVWVRPRQPEYSELEYQMRNWYYFNWLCGDHILEQHIHNIDVANWFLDEFPVSAQGMGGRQVRTGKEYGEIFDHHFVEFTYPSGAVISSQCRHQPGTYNRVAEQFQGTKGFVSTNDAAAAVLYDLGGNEIGKFENTQGHNPYQEEHNQLFKAIREDSILNNAEYGAKSTLTAIMGRMATYSGEVIKWEDALKSTHQIVPDEMTWDTPPPVMPMADGSYEIPTPGKTKVL